MAVSNQAGTVLYKAGTTHHVKSDTQGKVEKYNICIRECLCISDHLKAVIEMYCAVNIQP